MVRKIRKSREDRDEGELRSNRAMEDRTITGNRELSDSDRIDQFRQQFFQSALPDLPKIPGFHVCWLTTTNPRDPIHARLRLGYSPISAEEVPGWEHAALKTGDWAGCIGVNEMLAFKLPLNLYQAYMRHNHYDEPQNQEDKLREAARLAAQQAASSARRAPKLDVEEGLEGLEGQAPVPVPNFAEEIGEE